MARPRFTGHSPLADYVWTADLRISNSTRPSLARPSLSLVIADRAASFPQQKIELWERPLRMVPKNLYEVCFGLQSVTTLFAVQLQQARDL